jgi:hypothetical protein
MPIDRGKRRFGLVPKALVSQYEPEPSGDRAVIMQGSDGYALVRSVFPDHSILASAPPVIAGAGM